MVVVLNKVDTVLLNSNNDNLIIKRESSFSIVRIGFDTLSTTCVDNGPNILGNLSHINALLSQGENLNLEISATGSNLTYQWLKNFEPLKGMTSQVLKMINLKFSDSGSYTCEVIQNTIRVSSSIAKITVLELTIMYSIPPNQNFSEMFDIGILTGVILPKKPLDYEKATFHKFIVQAISVGANAAANANILVKVLDASNNFPFFVDSYKSINIEVKVSVRSIVYRVSAVDKDSRMNGVIGYKIKSGNINNIFDIDSTTGDIRINNSLDTNTERFTLYIIAFYIGRPSIESIPFILDIYIIGVSEIVLLFAVKLFDFSNKPCAGCKDIKYYAPAFPPSSLTVSLVDTSIPNQSVYQLAANDPDPGPDGYLKYNIVSVNNNGLFYIDLTVLVYSQLAPTTWHEVNTNVNSPKLIRYIAIEKLFPQNRVRRSVVNTTDSFMPFLIKPKSTPADAPFNRIFFGQVFYIYVYLCNVLAL
nr:fat-like cadherin-related tumor suppressor homolog [Hydra vulgaris]